MGTFSNVTITDECVGEKGDDNMYVGTQSKRRKTIISQTHLRQMG